MSGAASQSAVELVFANSRDLLDCYVAAGPGQLFAALPGPPVPGTLSVGTLVPVTLAFRDRPLRIQVRCRVLSVRDDGEGHWTTRLELVVGEDAREALHHTLSDAVRGWRQGARGPVRVCVTLPDGRRLETTARSLNGESIDLDRDLPPGASDLVKLSIRQPGKLLPLHLVGEPKVNAAGNSHIELLFRQPREELLWSQLAEIAATHPSRLLLA